ncbi:MAG TPA: protein-methionine-sulfoxide reductase heme-binding subunit MsrQ [Terracidiphilus sp.]|nr:protein-methionine-sulfoxide reductase heme-binding subunit MsrQ [Terracidiphilus sp.]
MKRSTLIVLKTLVWIGCLAPLATAIYEAVTNTLGPDPTAELASITGLTALWLLAGGLAISPVRALSPRLSWLIKFRRLLGLFVFFYATLHMLTWLGLYAGFDLTTIKTDITKRRFIIMGVTTWLLLLPLASTSTTWSIRKLGGKNWNRLHMLVYLAAITAMVHYWWKVKQGVMSPAPYTLVLLVLLGVRPLLKWNQRRKARAT